MKKLNIPLKLFLGVLFILTACENDDDTIKDCQEVITTIQYTLTPNSGGTPIILKYLDLDGDGGNTPTISEGVLNTNQTYLGTLELLDESSSNIENISQEILEETQDHQLFFISSISDLNVAYNDQDINGKPLGIKSILTTGNESFGSLKIILLQEPDKFSDGVSEGIIDNAGGETVMEISFPITVQ